MGNKAKTKKRVNGKSANAKPRPMGVHLKGSGAKYRTLFNAAWDGIVVIDWETGEIVDCNPEFENQTGRTLKRLQKMTIWELGPGEKVEDARRTFFEVGDNGVGGSAELEFEKPDGEIIEIEFLTKAVTIEGKQYLQSISRDVTKRRKAEEALRRSEVMMQQAQSLAHVGSWMWNLKDNSFLMSEELCRIYGIPEREQPGDIQAMIDEFVHPDDREHVQKARQTITRSDASEQLVYRIIRRDGEVRWISSTELDISRINEEGKPELVVGAIRDITEWKQADEGKERMEAQLRQSQKMDAIGRLAGGMAHDFNNLLTAIQGYSDLALMKLDGDDPAYQDVSHMRKASVRAAGLTEQLLLFSRPQPAAFKPRNLNKVIWDVLRMLKRVIGEKFTILTDFEPDLRTVNLDGGHIKQIVVNMAVNAKDAMPNGGEITIRTENLDVDQDYCRTHNYARPGEFVRLSVIDTGMGMNNETLSHIFEPFFSTKDQGKGTGLGLSVVYGIVKKHSGWIDVESTPGQGSCFMVYLPSNAERPEEERPEDDSGEAPKGKGEWILVVEDEDTVRELAEAVLAGSGYVVSGASSMKEAIRIFIKEEKDFSLVFSDIVLPDGNGVELVERLVSEKPELRVLLASGYAEEIANWQALEVKGYPFLQKPYAVSDLLRVVRELLDRKT